MINLVDSIVLFVWAMFFVIVLFREFFSKQRGNTLLASNAKIEPSVAKRRYWQREWKNTAMRSFIMRTDYNWMKSMRQRSLHGKIAEPLRLQQIGNKEGMTRILVENWRKSIVGLIELAEKNLDSAENHLEAKNYNEAVEAAFTSVENIARALIHCFGHKPDPSLGQEEPLRMLTQRFEGNERREFEMATDKIVELINNRTCVRSLSEHSWQIPFFDEAKTKQILESASKIANSYKQIIISHFAEEIPELLSTKVKPDVVRTCVDA